MKKLMHKLFLSCEEATRLEEKRKDEGLGFTQWMRLKVHLGMCRTCQSYSRLSDQMDRVFRKRFGSEDFLKVKMPDGKKKEILKTLDDQE